MSYLVNGVDIENFLNARKVFEDFRKNMVTDRDKAGAIQAFEFCYELAWKIMKRILENPDKSLYYKKAIFREAAVAGLISDPRIWFEFIEIRNITVHTYNKDNVEAVIAIFDDFSKALEELAFNLKELGNKNDLS
ncbi:HI0074 family nucleotidyltransferase substrate-binding subunit [Candidatus Trichorickettsia mobilis]|jgi:nucleotidyltransferase substrate binding protein (TIGR01987 family)|uniref:HI0074 family nucleotidyltransferase substrate-binding subunit n=1 Tax=Candidatus Trichorickettsia mobilis TaxID=1346319 RepID=UPI002931918E|nr:HI0074 family nucleotidyltransferase substrate-binding subunit [Candidatus Trichorickettsia mobilis]